MQIGNRVQINPVWDGVPRTGFGTIKAIRATVHDAAADFALEVADAMLKAREK